MENPPGHLVSGGFSAFDFASALCFRRFFAFQIVNMKKLVLAPLREAPFLVLFWNRYSISLDGIFREYIIFKRLY